jgi:hypothetical protein
MGFGDYYRLMQKGRVLGALQLTPNAAPTFLAQTIDVLAKTGVGVS